MSKVLIISDLQLPFAHKDSFEFLKQMKLKYKPDKIVCIGDFMDQHALSDYDTNPNGMSAGDELKAAIKIAKKFYQLFPIVDILTSNHDVRIYKKAIKSGIPMEYIKSYNEWMQAPATWVFHDRLVLDNVLYVHGHQVSGGQSVTTNAARRYMRPVVFGHWHSKFEIGYHATEDHLLWAMVVGCMIDAKTYAFEYEKTNINKPIVGCAVVTNGIPKLVPMVLRKNGRWDKTITL